MARTTDSEFRTYIYIENVLKDLGWDTSNPTRGGAVYTQGEFYRHDSLLTTALGQKAPENTILIPWDTGFRYWIVEAKRSHQQLKQALREAQVYSDKVNAVEPGAARFATGIAGTPDDSFYVTTTYWDGQKWLEVSINDFDTTGFLSLEQCKSILNADNPAIPHYEVDLASFLKKANDINEALHRNGVAARDRARMIAGLLLALVEEQTMRISEKPRTLANDINIRIRECLNRHGKEDFSPEVELKLPNTPENHKKYWRAIVQTMQALREINIRSAINSGTDALGQFYETFLKYANDANEMGIVLTPRHITRFAVDVIDLRHTDLIFDPTCGTGGFLVAALDSIRADYYTSQPDVYDTFRNDCLFGVEDSDMVFGLALVNMVFRGDGKSHIHNGNCFDNQYWMIRDEVVRLKPNDERDHDGVRPFTRVLMNPPFALDQKEHEFVDYALEQTRVGGLLFAVLPNGPITGMEEKLWREELLKRHTVKACVKFPKDLFIPHASKGTYGLILQAHCPHKSNDPVFFGVLLDDQHASNKSKTLSEVRSKDNMDAMTKELQGFMSGHKATNKPKEMGVFTLNMSLNYDFAPEAYLADELNAGMPAFDSTHSLLKVLSQEILKKPMPPGVNPKGTKHFGIEDLILLKRGKCPPIKYLFHGDIPVITTKETDNGINGYYAVKDEYLFENAFTISANGSGGKAFWHPYSFSATGDVQVGELQPWIPNNIEICLYICEVINQSAWRFDYYRKCSKSRFIQDVQIVLPMKGRDIDHEHIVSEVRKTPGFTNLMELLNDQGST